MESTAGKKEEKGSIYIYSTSLFSGIYLRYLLTYVKNVSSCNVCWNRKCFLFYIFLRIGTSYWYAIYTVIVYQNTTKVAVIPFRVSSIHSLSFHSNVPTNFCLVKRVCLAFWIKLKKLHIMMNKSFHAISCKQGS